MQVLLYYAVALYVLIYSFESPVRYLLSLIGADPLIFARDVMIAVPVIGLFLGQAFNRKIHPAFKWYFFILLFHGLIIWLNFRNLTVIAYSAKVLLSMLAGALAATAIFQPSRRTVLFVLILWAVTAVGVLLDKYYVDFPWNAMSTTIGDFHVDISRNWQITGEEKRAGGFMRSSINVAIIEPLLALILLFHLRRVWQKLAVVALTVAVLWWTTQKGALIGYLLTVACLAISPKRPVWSLKAGFAFALLLMIGLPLFMPGYVMPRSGGVISMESFYLRIEWMWPAWDWIRLHELFPFGVGLGGIGGGQRFYAPVDINAADNMYIYLYGNFGIMVVLYIGWAAWQAFGQRNDAPKPAAHALATLVFVTFYGVVLSLPEDQMASLFLGAAAVYLWQERRGMAQEGRFIH